MGRYFPDNSACATCGEAIYTSEYARNADPDNPWVHRDWGTTEYDHHANPATVEIQALVTMRVQVAPPHRRTGAPSWEPGEAERRELAALPFVTDVSKPRPFRIVEFPGEGMKRYDYTLYVVRADAWREDMTEDDAKRLTVTDPYVSD